MIVGSGRRGGEERIQKTKQNMGQQPCVEATATNSRLVFAVAERVIDTEECVAIDDVGSNGTQYP